MTKNLFSAYRANGKFKLANALESTRRGLIEGDKAMKLMRDIAYKKRKEAQVNLLAQPLNFSNNIFEFQYDSVLKCVQVPMKNAMSMDNFT